MGQLVRLLLLEERGVRKPNFNFLVLLSFSANRLTPNLQFYSLRKRLTTERSAVSKEI